jgi:hypothetical protein
MELAWSTVAETDGLPPLKFAATEQSVQFLPTNKLDHPSPVLSFSQCNWAPTQNEGAHEAHHEIRVSDRSRGDNDLRDSRNGDCSGR